MRDFIEIFPGKVWYLVVVILALTTIGCLIKPDAMSLALLGALAIVGVLWAYCRGWLDRHREEPHD